MVQTMHMLYCIRREISCKPCKTHHFDWLTLLLGDGVNGKISVLAAYLVGFVFM